MLRTRLRALGAASGGAAVQPLRAVTNANRIASGGFSTVSGTSLQVKSRIGFTTGAGALSQIVLSFYNWRSDPSGFVLNTNAYTIVSAALEIEGGTYAPVTFSASRSRVVAAGATDIQSDPILPASFSLGSIPAGTKFWLRLHISLTTAGHGLPGGVPYEGAGGGAYPEWVGFAYDPAVNTTTGAIDGTGTLANGTAISGFGSPVFPVVLGRFVSGSPRTWLGIGDSIMQGLADNLEGLPYGYAGFFARSLINATFNGGWGGGINMGSSGTTHGMWSGINPSVAKAYWAYCTGAVENYGTNNFDSGATLASVQTASQALWTDLRAAGITTILRMHILPRTNSTDSWATAGANQTGVNAAFNSGGLVAQYNTWLGTQISGSAITAQLAFTTLRDATFPEDWVVTGAANYATSDGVHLSAATSVLAANALRTLLASYP